jgi:hypothetical protein
MNPYQTTISQLQKDIDEVFNQLNRHLIEYDNRIYIQMFQDKWTGQQIFEQVSLTNYYRMAAN